MLWQCGVAVLLTSLGLGHESGRSIELLDIANSMGSLSERLAQGRLDATTFRLQQDIVRRLDAQIAELESEDGVRGAIDNTGTPSTEADEEPLWSMPLVRQLHEIVEISQGIDDRLMRVTIGG